MTITIIHKSPKQVTQAIVLEPLCLRGPKCADYTGMKASRTIMPNNDEAQHARARSLRDQFRQLKSKGTAGPAADKSASRSESTNPVEEAKQKSPTKESPREFIHRRMRELDAPTESATKSRKS